MKYTFIIKNSFYKNSFRKKKLSTYINAHFSSSYCATFVVSY